MTVLVGVRCRDGVVIGTDSAVTYAPVPDPQHFTAEAAHGRKIFTVGGDILVATTGEIGLAQRLELVLKNLISGAYQFNGKPLNNFRQMPKVEIGTIISQFANLEFGRTRQPYERSMNLGALIGIYAEGEPRLIWIESNFFRPELVGEQDATGKFRTLPVTSLGSGQKLADPFMLHAHRVLFGVDHFPTVAEGRLLIVWTLDHVIRYNVGGVGGTPHMCSLEQDGANWIVRQSPDDEVRQSVELLEKHIGLYPSSLKPAAAPDLVAEIAAPKVAG